MFNMFPFLHQIFFPPGCTFQVFHFLFLDKCDNLQKQNREAIHTIKEQKDLILQLENDVLNLNSLPSTFRGQGEGEATPAPHTEIVEKAVQGVLQEGDLLLVLLIFETSQIHLLNK